MDEHEACQLTRTKAKKKLVNVLRAVSWRYRGFSFFYVFWLGMVVSTVESNRDWDQDFLINRDRLLKLWRFFSTVETRFVFVSFEIFKIEIFWLRFCCVKISIEIVETVDTNWDFWDLSRFVKIRWYFLRLIEKSRHYQAFLMDFKLKNLDQLRNLDLVKS